MKYIRHFPKITFAGWYKKLHITPFRNVSYPFPRLSVIDIALYSSISGIAFLCQVYSKKIITWHFPYLIHHHPLVQLSTLKPTGSLAEIAGPRADKGSDMKEGHVIIYMYMSYLYILISVCKLCIFMSHNRKLVPRIWITQSLYVIMQ